MMIYQGVSISVLLWLLWVPWSGIWSVSAFLITTTTSDSRPNCIGTSTFTTFACSKTFDYHHRHYHLQHATATDYEGEVLVTRTYNNDANNNTDDELTTTKNTSSSHTIHYRIHKRMNLSSQQAAPMLVLHGGPGIPSDYLLPLRQVIPYRSIVFYDQLGCGRSPGPETQAAYSIESSLDDLELVIKHSGLQRFHLYGQSFGGILAFEYMKRIAERKNNNDDDRDAPKCLSAILSSTPCDVQQVEARAGNLIAALLDEDPDETTVMERFQARHVCQKVVLLDDTDKNGKKKRVPPQPLTDAYQHAGTVWRGTGSIQDWAATAPSESAQRLPSCMILRGENDFVTEDCVEGWSNVFNHQFVRFKELQQLSHHGLLENGAVYGEIVDQYFSQYD